MQRKITKAVFPVAGLGSRFLPATKAQPKEMLPVVDKPLIQYAVEEAYAAGIRDMIFVTGRNKRAIEDHYDTAYELESQLEASGKIELLHIARSVMPAATASSTAYWISGLSTMGSISFGLALVAGRNRVPSPATGNTATSMRFFLSLAGIRAPDSGPKPYHDRNNSPLRGR